MTKATGVDWIDHVLDGGLPDQGCYLAVGPAFSGYQLFARGFALQGMEQGDPSLFVTTDETASTYRDELAELDEEVPTYEKDGLLWFVDTYSHSVDAPRDVSSAAYVEAAMDLNKVTIAVNRILQKIVPDNTSHRLVVDSVSTLCAYTSIRATFRFLQVLVGRCKMAGGTAILLLDPGMHEEREVQMVKHLVDGTFEFRREEETGQLRIEGFVGVPSDRWVDYEIEDSTLTVVGSLGEGRIP